MQWRHSLHFAFYEGYAPSVDIAALHAADRQDAQKVLDDAVALARQQGLAPESSLLEPGDEPLSNRILEEVRSWNADLLVHAS